jgi:hypothetical protein
MRAGRSPPGSQTEATAQTPRLFDEGPVLRIDGLQGISGLMEGVRMPFERFFRIFFDSSTLAI